MIKKIILGVISLVLLVLPVFISSYSLAQENAEDSNVTISGRVYCRNYASGQKIKVFARASLGRDVPDIASAEINGPGDYSLKVPRDAGDVYILAAVILAKGKSLSRGGATLGMYDEAIKVGKSDITGIDITIADYKPVTMATYKGPTVNIYGRVVYPDFKEGQQIIISAKSSSRSGPPDVAVLNLSEPGDYSLKVPQNAGNVYIQAVVFRPEEGTFSRNKAVLRYRGNPLTIEDRNISGVDLSR